MFKLTFSKKNVQISFNKRNNDDPKTSFVKNVLRCVGSISREEYCRMLHRSTPKKDLPLHLCDCRIDYDGAIDCMWR